MRALIFTNFILLNVFSAFGQSVKIIDSIIVYDDIKITIDKPIISNKAKRACIIFYALPNGNTTAMTMGKKIQAGDDWHFDIQHIQAQTAFIRASDPHTEYVVCYLENSLKSWPVWKNKHLGYKKIYIQIIDSIYHAYPAKVKSVYLNGHSGGGSFIFGFLDGVENIPAYVKRISFLDSDYGYAISFYSKFKKWLRNVKKSCLNVFAYNDSIALYNGKRIVSDTGGTWVRSHLFLNDLKNDFKFNETISDSIVMYKGFRRRIQFFFKPNYNRGIYHTQQVELNGFIHSIFCGTRFDSRGYQYYGSRAYTKFIE